jgi:hypothetical protein
MFFGFREESIQGIPVPVGRMNLLDGIHSGFRSAKPARFQGFRRTFIRRGNGSEVHLQSAASFRKPLFSPRLGAGLLERELVLGCLGAYDPTLGELAKGDLADVRLNKFRMINQLALLAYMYEDARLVLTLLALAAHENFYRELK